jgi:hypothetical protein
LKKNENTPNFQVNPAVGMGMMGMGTGTTPDTKMGIDDE